METLLLHALRSSSEPFITCLAHRYLGREPNLVNYMDKREQ